MRRTFNRFLQSALLVTLSLGAVRIALSDGSTGTTERFYTGVGGSNAVAAGSPLILNLGPPPVVYSPSADFSARVETAPGWAVASDVRTVTVTSEHPVLSAPPILAAHGGPMVQPNLPVAMFPVPYSQGASGMQTVTVPCPLPGMPSYYAPPPSPPFANMVPSMPTSAPAFNPAVVFPSQLATRLSVPAPRTNQVYSSPAAGEAEHLDHIMQAVHHLEAAGLQADADRLRRESDDKVERLIECFKSNEAELSRLHQATANLNSDSMQSTMRPPVVTAKMCMLEIDLNKLEALPLASQNDAVAKFTKSFQSHPQGGFESFPGDLSELESAIESLQKRKVVDVLSRPAIATISGQEAHLEIGQSVPHAGLSPAGEPCVTQEFVGFTANVLPEVIDRNTVRMLVRASCSEPGTPVRAVESIVVAHCGEPVILGGLQTNTDGKKTGKLLVICPQIDKNPDGLPPPPLSEHCASASAGACGANVRPASMELETISKAQACNGPCDCGNGSACNGVCGGNCTCASAVPCTEKETTEAEHKPIFVQVQVLELNRSKMRELGFDFASLNNTAHWTCGPGVDGCRDNPFCLKGCENAKSNAAGCEEMGCRTAFLECLDSLGKAGAVKVLSNPSIYTLSGRPTRLHCGGEIGIPVKQSDGTTTVQYKKYGTEIECVSNLLDADRLRMEIRARVSSIGQPQACSAESAIPALTDVYEFDTAAELHSGQSMVIVGPVHERLCSEFVEETSVPQCLEPFVGCLEDNSLAAAIFDALGLEYSKTRNVEHTEEVQSIAIVRAEVGKANQSQPLFNAAAFGAEFGCAEPTGVQSTLNSRCDESAFTASTQVRSCAVQPVSCFALPSAAHPLFEQALVDMPLLPSEVQQAVFAAPQLFNGQPTVNFDFDFQIPITAKP